MNIPIVVVAYNREHTLKRILYSLSKAHYPCGVKLIISIDGGGPVNVIKVAKKFVWEHGEKKIIEHNRNLGLREHILSCGAISQEYDGIILLEDDLYVSPWFYDYALGASVFYQGCQKISGISLYSPRYNETAFLPFHPLNDGLDVFFMQLACSWGQIWLREQWSEFYKWYLYIDNNNLINDKTLPINVKMWPETSWKKYFVQFMILNKKYFVYPRHSYSTNFGDQGQHHYGMKIFQVPLVLGAKETFNFVKLKNSNVRYDAFCEIEPNSLKQFSDNLSGYEFVVDLYGTKEKHHFDKKYVITSKKCSEFSISFDKSLLPIELNIIESIHGDKLFLTKVEDVIVERDMNKYRFLKANNIDEQKYHYAINDLHFSMIKQKNECLIRNSYSYRIGRAIVFPFSFLKRLIGNFMGK